MASLFFIVWKYHQQKGYETMRLITYYPEDVCEEYQKRINFRDITFSHLKPWVQRAITHVGRTTLCREKIDLGANMDIERDCLEILPPGQ